MRFLLLSLVLFASCASLRGKPHAMRAKEPLLQRGWSFVESEKEFLEQEAGVSQVSFSAPVLAGEKIIFGSERFGLTAIAKRNGQKLWQQPMENGISAQPLADEKSVYAGTESGVLSKFDLDSGRPLWNVTLTGPVHGAMILAYSRLYVGTEDEALHAVDPATGKVLWSYRRPAYSGTAIKGGGNPAAIAGKVWIGFSDGALVSLDPETGAMDSERQYRDNLKFTDVDARVVGWKDGLLVSTYDGKLRHIKRDGTVVWEFGGGSARAPLVTDGDEIFFPSSEGSVVAMNGAGRELWRYSLKRGVPTGVGMVSKKDRRLLVVVSSEDKVYVLDANDGAPLAESGLGRGSGSYAPLAVDDGSVYILSNYSRIHQYRLHL